MNNERLADFFIDQGVMDRAQADDVLLETTQNGKAIEQAMVDHGIVDEAQFYQTIADALGTEVVDLETSNLLPRFCATIPARTGTFAPRLADGCRGQHNPGCADRSARHPDNR